MNFKELIMPVIFALIATMALQYIFFGTKEKVQTETSFIAPTEKKEYKPLDIEVDFWDQKRPGKPYLTDIETAWSLLQFSTYGASLNSLDIKREIDGSAKTIRTIFPMADTERENQCFLVALQEKTPFYYSLVSFDEEQDSYRLVYRGENDACMIHKTFVVEKKVPKIDIILEISSFGERSFSVIPRILYPAPLMIDIHETDAISAIVIDQSNIFSKIRVEQLNVHTGWFDPKLFGSDSRYCINAMIKDENAFSQRAYYKLENRDRLFSILEGPKIEKQTSWHLSFYCGPKDLKLMSEVDERLEKTLDYSGWLSYLAKIMLYLLNWFYKYLHNYGLAIIALTLAIQILLLPFTMRNSEEKFKRQQKEYQKKLALLDQRFKDSPDKLAVERADLIRKEGFPGFGCLIPFLLQIPIFFALSRVLSSSFELYQAPMLWIKDLSVKDPYYILPLIITFTMLVSDGKGDAQQRIAKYMMAIVFGVITASFSAGLALYLACNRVFSLIQSMIIRYFNLV